MRGIRGRKRSEQPREEKEKEEEEDEEGEETEEKAEGEEECTVGECVGAASDDALEDLPHATNGEFGGHLVLLVLVGEGEDAVLNNHVLHVQNVLEKDLTQRKWAAKGGKQGHGGQWEVGGLKEEDNRDRE